MHLRRLRAAALLIGLLAAPACGSSSSTDTAAPTDSLAPTDTAAPADTAGSSRSASVSSVAEGAGSTSSVAPASTAGSIAATTAGAAAVLPDVAVVDVATGRTMTLASLVAADKPTLFWAWAPY